MCDHKDFHILFHQSAKLNSFYQTLEKNFTRIYSDGTKYENPCDHT